MILQDDTISIIKHRDLHGFSNLTDSTYGFPTFGPQNGGKCWYINIPYLEHTGMSWGFTIHCQPLFKSEEHGPAPLFAPLLTELFSTLVRIFAGSKSYQWEFQDPKMEVPTIHKA